MGLRLLTAEDERERERERNGDSHMGSRKEDSMIAAISGVSHLFSLALPWFDLKRENSVVEAFIVYP